MEYILDRNLIDINQTSAGYTPLMKAVLANRESAARLLISRGADTGMRSPSGKTAAFCGAQRTPMRFRADAMRSITDAPKRGFQVTVLAESLQCNASLPA